MLYSIGAFKQPNSNFTIERKAMTHKWMFVGDIPLLYKARNVARQLEIEFWLDPQCLLKTLSLKPVDEEKTNKPKYIA